MQFYGKLLPGRRCRVLPANRGRLAFL